MNAQELRDWENQQWREHEELVKLADSHKLKAKDARDAAEELVAKIKTASLRLNTDQAELELPDGAAAEGVDGMLPKEPADAPAEEPVN